MNNFKIENDEGILYEGIIDTNKNKNIQLSITSKKLIFQKEKGILKKNLKVIDEILLDDIAMYKNKVQVKQNKNILKIQTTNKKIVLDCKNIIEATKIKECINNIKVGSNVVNRTIGKVGKLATGGAILTTGLIGILKNSKTIANNSKEIIKMVGNIIKKK